MQQSASPLGGEGRIRDVSGTFVDANLASELISFLRESLVLDECDDAVRLVLAGELWGIGRWDEARAEYQRIVDRGSMQSVVASRVLIEIAKACATSDGDVPDLAQ